MTPTELVTRWLSEAEHLRPYNAGAAHAFETAAHELEAALREVEGEALTLQQASRESGYSADHLRHLIAANQLPNAGKRGAPRIARKDLPKRAGRAQRSAYDPATDARSLVSGRRSA
jgi:hypothetical protein